MSFWYDDYSILFQFDKITHCIPNSSMTSNEQLNSLVRLSWYTAMILFFILRYSYVVFYIPLLTMLFTYGIFKISNQNETHVQKESPTEIEDNPFRNRLLTDREPSPSTTFSLNTETPESFYLNLYRDVDDVWGRGNSQRQFFTMPLNDDQGAFAQFLYPS